MTHNRAVSTPPSHNPQPQFHTDACIADAIRYGFCDHTLLRAPGSARARRGAAEQRARKRARLRDRLAWVSTVILFGTFITLFTQIGWWAFLAFSLGGLGWLGIFLFGLPYALTADIRDTLPPDTRDRLR
jgi:hypothetical protein